MAMFCKIYHIRCPLVAACTTQFGRYPVIIMSKRKKHSQREAAQIRKKQKRQKTAVSRVLWLLIPIILFAGIYYMRRGVSSSTDIGSVTACQGFPAFINQLGTGPQATIGTTIQGVIGLGIVDPSLPNGIYQDPTWDDAGYLGPFIYDNLGNIFTAGVPYVSLDENPPEEQNRIYQVDAQTGIMTLYIDLPAARPPDEFNPFGVLGLAYDCETNSLYVTSVSGSTVAEEAGRIFQIDLGTGAVVDQFEGIDVMGIGVFKGSTGKRLYFGPARSNVVKSIALNSQGNFTGEPRREFSLADLGVVSSDNIRRIIFPNNNEMQMKGVEFNYNPVVASGAVQTTYQLKYDAQTDSWELLDVQQTDPLGGGS